MKCIFFAYLFPRVGFWEGFQKYDYSFIIYGLRMKSGFLFYTFKIFLKLFPRLSVFQVFLTNLNFIGFLKVFWSNSGLREHFFRILCQFGVKLRKPFQKDVLNRPSVWITHTFLENLTKYFVSSWRCGRLHGWRWGSRSNWRINRSCVR